MYRGTDVACVLKNSLWKAGQTCQHGPEDVEPARARGGPWRWPASHPIWFHQGELGCRRGEGQAKAGEGTKDDDRLPPHTTRPPGLPGHVLGATWTRRAPAPIQLLMTQGPWIDLYLLSLSFSICGPGHDRSGGGVTVPSAKDHACWGHCAVPAPPRALSPDRGLRGRTCACCTPRGVAPLIKVHGVL